MVKSALAFLGLAFLIYWLSVSDTQNSEAKESLDPVPPQSVKVLDKQVEY